MCPLVCLLTGGLSDLCHTLVFFSIILLTGAESALYCVVNWC